MKKVLFILVVIISTLTAAQCKTGQKNNLVGIWKLEHMEVNGTIIYGHSLGNWLWEFNDEGGYLTDVAAVREKGRYTLSAKTLTLKAVTTKNKAPQSYNIVKLDSTTLHISSTANGTKTDLYFIKVDEGEGVEKD